MKSLQRHKGTKITIENDYHRPRSITAQTTQQIVKVIENRPDLKNQQNPSSSKNQLQARSNPVELPVIDRDLIPRIVKDISKDEDDQEIIKPVTKPPIVLPILPILSKDSSSSGSVPTPPTPTQTQQNTTTTTSAPKTREKPRETAPSLVTNSDSGQYQQPTPAQMVALNQPVETVQNVVQATSTPTQMTFSSKFDKFKTLQDRQAKQEREQRQKKEEEKETKKKLEKKTQAKHKSSKPSQVTFYNDFN